VTRVVQALRGRHSTEAHTTSRPMLEFVGTASARAAIARLPAGCVARIRPVCERSQRALPSAASCWPA
jgi:hypothetical protein